MGRSSSKENLDFDLDEFLELEKEILLVQKPRATPKALLTFSPTQRKTENSEKKVKVVQGISVGKIVSKSKAEPLKTSAAISRSKKIRKEDSAFSTFD